MYCCYWFVFAFAIFLFFFCLFLSFFFFLFSLVVLHGLWTLDSLARGWAWASGVGALSPGCWAAREFLGPGNIKQHTLSERYTSQHQDPAPTNCQQAPVMDTSHQTTSKTGTETNSSADRLPKVVLSSQTPQNTLPDVALPFRGKRLSSTYQSAGTSPSHQEAYRSPRINLTHQEADNSSKRNYDPAACGKETINPVS